MKNQERRKKILEILRNSSSPVTGDQLAKDLDVSRQVIVLDMALLRSAGTAIVSTRRGYQINGRSLTMDFECRYKAMDTDGAMEEMNIVVDNGGMIGQHYFAAGFLRTDPGVLESEEPSGCKTVSGKFPGLQHPSDRYPFQRDPYPDGGS